MERRPARASRERVHRKASSQSQVRVRKWESIFADDCYFSGFPNKHAGLLHLFTHKQNCLLRSTAIWRETPATEEIIVLMCTICGRQA